MPIQVANIAGWIPGVSVISGVVFCVLGISKIAAYNHDHHLPDKKLGQVWIARGLLQTSQVGIPLIAALDISCSIMRSLRHLCQRKGNAPAFDG